VPLQSKTGAAVAEAFGSILADARYSKPFACRPVTVQTDRGREFLNKPFQDLLRREGIEHRTGKNPDVKLQSFRELYEQSETNYTDISLTKTRIDT
jgi:transposase InsO family protein